jgi:hypothetical protein
MERLIQAAFDEVESNGNCELWFQEANLHCGAFILPSLP